MTGRIGRYSFIGASALLLILSVGVIYWIARDERMRLAERERQAIETAKQASFAEQAVEDKRDGTDHADMEPIFHDIDTLLSELSNDDLPSED
jgi:hypothetical protein